MNIKDKARGLYAKYVVTRIDGTVRPDDRFFVLNYGSDPNARKALEKYIEIIRDDYPELARDLWIELRETAPQGDYWRGV